MDLELKRLYRKVEEYHFNKPYNSYMKSIQVVIDDEDLSAEEQLSIIIDIVKDYYEDLNYVEESEYL